MNGEGVVARGNLVGHGAVVLRIAPALFLAELTTAARVVALLLLAELAARVTTRLRVLRDRGGAVARDTRDRDRRPGAAHQQAGGEDEGDGQARSQERLLSALCGGSRSGSEGSLLHGVELEGGESGPFGTQPRLEGLEILVRLTVRIHHP